MGDHGDGHLSPSRRHLPLRRTGSGTFKVVLGDQDREVLRELPKQLRLSANRGDPAFRRLFPPAYANDPEAEAEYQYLVADELDESRSKALETLSSTADATELSEEQLDAWLRALNDIRLWLGTVLDVGEDETLDEPEDPAHILYYVLTWLQELAIQVLSEED